MSNFGFLPVSISTLYASEGLDLDLYIRPPGCEQPVLFCASTLGIRKTDLDRLEDAGVTALYIQRQARARYQTYLREHLDDWLRDPALPSATRAAVLNEVVRDVLRDSFSRGQTDAVVGQARQLGERAAALLTSEPILFQDIVRVLHHDYGTFTHSANVCYLAVLLGIELGMPADDLVQIAVGGLLHDLGKLDISDRILMKEGPLDELEWREIRKHPTTGFLKLCHRTELSLGQLMMVYQHHERTDGSGYPVGIVGNEIHPWARLCAIVDVYEALTSHRPYRHSLSQETALGVMSKNGNQKYDQEMLACWIKLTKRHSPN